MSCEPPTVFIRPSYAVTRAMAAVAYMAVACVDCLAEATIEGVQVIERAGAMTHTAIPTEREFYRAAVLMAREQWREAR